VPRYNYKCSACDVEMIITHLMDDKIDFCTSCQEFGTMIKLLTILLYKSKATVPEIAGESTIEYIEANKEVLQHQKENAKRETYEPT